MPHLPRSRVSAIESGRVYPAALLQGSLKDSKTGRFGQPGARERNGFTRRARRTDGRQRTSTDNCVLQAAVRGVRVAPSPAALGRPPLPYRERLLGGHPAPRLALVLPCSVSASRSVRFV